MDRRILHKYSQQLSAAECLWLGFSGGLDSSVLLSCLCEWGDKHKLRALHVHHGLSANADDWALHCEQVCTALGVAFECVKVQVVKDGRGLEDAARSARYAVFEKILTRNSILLTAHHLDDQAETFFLRLMRGSGLQGLTAMSAWRPLGEGHLMRPLLYTPRSELELWARARKLLWIDDESNRDRAYDRNFLRLDIFPKLRERWPGFASQVQRSVELLEEGAAVIDCWAADRLRECDLREERVGQSLEIDKLLRLPDSERRLVLRYWMKIRGERMPGRERMDEIHSVLFAREDAAPCLHIDKLEFRRFQGRLYLLEVLKAAPGDARDWPGGSEFDCGDGFFLQRPASQLQVPLRVEWRREGLRCKPLGRAHGQSLKKLLQEYRLEPWLRDRVPLIYLDDTLIAVGDLWRCAHPALDDGDAFVWRYIKAATVEDEDVDADPF